MVKKKIVQILTVMTLIPVQCIYAPGGVDIEAIRSQMRANMESVLERGDPNSFGGKLTPAERARRDANLRKQEEAEVKAGKGGTSTGTGTGGGSRGTQTQSQEPRQISSGDNGGGTQAPVYRSSIQRAADRRGELTREAEAAVADVAAAARNFAEQVRVLNDKKSGKDAGLERDRDLYLRNFEEQIKNDGLQDAFTPKERTTLVEGLARAKNTKELNKAQTAVEKALAKKVALKEQKEKFESDVNGLLRENHGIKPSGSGEKISQFRDHLREFEQGTVPLKTIEKEFKAIQKFFK